MKIGTWNVWYAFKDRLDAIGQVLAENEADIWILTETHDDLVPSGCQYVVHSAERPKNWSGIRPGSRWVSIWSKYPIKKIHFEQSDSERTVIAMLDLGENGSLLVYGTVLPWKDDRKIPGWSEHHRIIDDQSTEWRELRKMYPDMPFCIAGDFNSDMNDGRRYGTQQGVDALRKGLSKCGTFCATEPELFPSGLLQVLPIDHIALPIDWKPKTSVIAAWPADRETLSDHSGMVVEIDI